MRSDESITFEPFRDEHVESIAALCRELSWPSYSEPSGARRALAAPGAVTWLARDGDRVVGIAHLLTDGLVQSHLSLVGVLPRYRRRGIAQRLVLEAFRATGSKWLDLVAEPGSEPFYRSFPNKEGVGFRIYPGKPAA